VAAQLVASQEGLSSKKLVIGEHLSDTFPIQCGLKQVDALLPLFFNFALVYTIRKV
jgi:hypothetical protein